MNVWKRRTLSSICLLLLTALLCSCNAISSLIHTHVYQYRFDEGSHWTVCTDCGEESQKEAHTLLLKESVEATCEHVGYRLYECKTCGYTLTDVAPALSHQFEAVPDSDTRVCSICHREETVLTELPDTERYGYRYLASLEGSEVYLRTYLKLAAGIGDRKNTVTIGEKLTKEELEVIFYCCSADHPEYFWLASRYEYSYIKGSPKNTIKDMQLYHLVSAGDFEKAKNAFREAADDILAGISASMTDFEKELFLHNTIVARAVYDETYEAPLTHSAYGNLVLGTSVCDGYTKLFQYLLCRCGILSVSISGYSGENHSWNAVLLDGNWYMTDLTWDDPIGQETGDSSHNYFNCTWEQFALDHSFVTPEGEAINNYFAIPSCVSDEYNYFTYFGYIGTLSIETIDKVIRAQIKAGEHKKFEICFTGHGSTIDEKSEAIRSFLKNDERLYPTLAKALGRPTASIKLSFSISKDGNILKLTVE